MNGEKQRKKRLKEERDVIENITEMYTVRINMETDINQNVKIEIP